MCRAILDAARHALQRIADLARAGRVVDRVAEAAARGADDAADGARGAAEEVADLLFVDKNEGG